MGRLVFVSFSLLVVFLSLSGTAADCPSGWSSYEGHCYKPFNEPKNWDDAERFCLEQAKGGHLVSIESSEEADFVAQLVANNVRRGISYIWIGLRVQGEEKQCSTKWSDGSSVNYENWIEALSKTCLGLEQDTNHKWVNIYCGEINPFVCKA
uniref:Snaclec 3 n=1 Tax=Sistrurus catenatus edwardsii TaxID=8762 RepID=SL3_SISCA|nr:RecName: Full=Snaclec 3; AltName: Full=C-type lectin isoform 3; Flags: Precursor [Sistrurus catenatus edwardsi]ABG26987.1 C-type lectin isoform 3 [Sistrurus catenatus edwardsi]